MLYHIYTYEIVFPVIEIEKLSKTHKVTCTNKEDFSY